MPDPVRRTFTRRRLFRLAAGGVALAAGAETVRVFALTNKHTVIPGRVYRTAQLTGPELSTFIADKGIKTVINLRGLGPDTAWYQGEAQATHAANVSQEDVTLSAKRLPAPAEVRRLVDVFDHTEYPVVVHCQRGADRTGLASTVAMLLQPGVSVGEARGQLSPRYGHVRGGRTVVIDDFFDLYDEWLAGVGRSHTPDRFREWVATGYCPGPYKAELTLLGPPAPTATAGTGFALRVRATNRSIRPWQFQTGRGGVQLRYELYNTGGVKLHRGYAGLRAALVPPGESIDLVAAYPPVKAAGRYIAHLDLLDSGAIELFDSEFTQYGSEPLVVTVTVE